jgi:hypothetical protein
MELKSRKEKRRKEEENPIKIGPIRPPTHERERT